jgi:ABC-type polar amino acid transport system ATPase subunit
MIKIEHLSKRFHDNIVLDDISLEIHKGEVLGIIGPSGTGKSTLLRCMNLLEKPERGTITIGDFSMDFEKRNRQNTLELRRRTGMVFQQFNLFKQKTALQNVMEGLVVVKKIPPNRAEIIAREQLDAVGLGDRLYHYPQHLSGGQQQRVAIARAFAMEPDVLLFDEPTSALDPELTGEVLDTIGAAAKGGIAGASDRAMLLVSHEMSFVRSIATRVIFLDGGKIVEDGTPEEVFGRPKSARAREFIAKVGRLSAPEYTI